MPASEVDWIPPLLILAAGCIVGIILLLQVRAKAPVLPVDDSGSIDDRRRRFDSIVVQLRELQDGADTVADGDRMGETSRLEVEAALLLREIETLKIPVAEKGQTESKRPAVASGNEGFFQQRPALRRLVWFTGTSVVAAVMYVILMQSAKPREVDGALTGNLPERSGGGSAATPAGPAIAALLQRADANPNDLEARNDLAKAYLEQQDLMNVFQQTKLVLDRDPDNARALSYQALVRLAIGEVDEARAMVTRAIERDPNLLDAWLNLAIIHLQTGNNEAALQTLQVAKQRHPEEAAMLNEIEQEMRQRIASGPPGGQAGGQAASAPNSPPSQAVAPASSPAQSVAGEIRLANGAAPPRAGSLLFLTVREAGSRLGAPIAAQRLSVSTFPMRFSIGQEHSMQGRPFPDSSRIEVRIDSDGDPLTKDPKDLTASADEVRKGASGLTLSLAPPSL